MSPQVTKVWRAAIDAVKSADGFKPTPAWQAELNKLSEGRAIRWAPTTAPGSDHAHLSLGPLLYYWSRDDTLAFYAEAANWPVARVYLGESVCSRRHLLRLPDWLALAEQLTAAGKDVVLSSQTLIESESDLKALRRMVNDGRFLVEANEWGAVRLLSEAGCPLRRRRDPQHLQPGNAGPARRIGASRWVPPVEMSQGHAGRHAACPAGMETEVFAYGRLPLAYSARCFTARHYNLPKDDCQFRCLDHPDGLRLATREGEAFLTSTASRPSPPRS